MKQYESGRSMVEMLGTLAIIGVLSVGGIAGYSYAMDKYRANTIMNDVMLIGIDIITQLSQQRTQAPVLSADFGTQTSAGYSISIVQNPDDETQYGIQLMGIPSNICKIVGDGLKNTVAVYVGGEEQNSETEEDPCDKSDSNTMEFYFDTTNLIAECKTDADCGEGNYCDTDMGWCFSGDKPIGSYGAQCTSDSDCGECKGSCSSYGQCSDIYSKHGEKCSTPSISDGICFYGECLAKGCNDKTPCKGAKQYCASPNNSDTEAFPNNSTGVCNTANFVRHQIDGKTYYISNYKLSWWDADAICKTLGNNYSLLSLSDFLIDWDGDNTKEFQPSKLLQALDNIIGYGIWTKDHYNSSQTYYVYPWAKQAFLDMHSYNSSTTYNYAICHKNQ